MYSAYHNGYYLCVIGAYDYLSHAKPLPKWPWRAVVRKMGEESLFGDALTLGAVSFYDFLKKENEGKKVFVCNGSACLCAGTQAKLRGQLGGFFKEEEIGHICCLGRCHQGGAFQFGGKNYSGQPAEALEQLFATGSGDAEDRYAVVSHLEPAQ